MMNTNSRNPLLPKQPESDADTPREMGQVAVENTVGPNHEKTFTRLRRETSNPVVKTLVILGVLSVTVGLFTAFAFSVMLGILLMILGSAAIISCIFLPVGTNTKP